MQRGLRLIRWLRGLVADLAGCRWMRRLKGLGSEPSSLILNSARLFVFVICCNHPFVLCRLLCGNCHCCGHDAASGARARGRGPPPRHYSRNVVGGGRACGVGGGLQGRG